MKELSKEHNCTTCYWYQSFADCSEIKKEIGYCENNKSSKKFNLTTDDTFICEFYKKL